MEYTKLERPIYWIGYIKGKFTKRKFVEYQTKHTSHYRAEDGTERFISNYAKMKFGKLNVVGGYAMYAYEDFSKNVELDFLHQIVKYQNERLKEKEKEIKRIVEERDCVIELIKQMEK